MTATGDIKVGALVTFTVKVNGAAVPDELNVHSIAIEQFINRIPLARITLIDGDPANGQFSASSSSTFVPGTDISIEAGYDFAYKTIFKGIITQQSIRINEGTGA